MKPNERIKDIRIRKHFTQAYICKNNNVNLILILTNYIIPDYRKQQGGWLNRLVSFFAFKPIRIPFLPVPAIPDHLIDPVLSTPAKFALGFRGVRVNDRNIAGTTVINDIRDLDAVHSFKGFHELQNAVALPCSKVVHCESTIVLDRLESVYVASGEVLLWRFTSSAPKASDSFRTIMGMPV